MFICVFWSLIFDWPFSYASPCRWAQEKLAAEPRPSTESRLGIGGFGSQFFVACRIHLRAGGVRMRVREVQLALRHRHIADRLIAFVIRYSQRGVRLRGDDIRFFLRRKLTLGR